MWNFFVRKLVTHQPFRIWKSMIAAADSEASMETIFFSPTSGYCLLDPILKLFFFASNIGIRFCFIVGPLIFILYLVIDARTFNDYAEGFYALITIAVNSVILVNIHFKRPLMLKMIDNFEDFFRKRNQIDPDTRKHYTDAVKSVEEWTLIILVAFIVVTLCFTACTYFWISWILYFATDRGEDSFTLPFPVWCPWNWRTPIGYFILFGIEIVPMFYITLICSCNMALHIGTCRLMNAFCNDVKEQLSSLDACNKETSRLDECIRRFRKLADLHTDAKQFPPQLSEAFKYYYTLHFAWTLLTICITLLMLQTELLEPDPSSSALLRIVVLTFWSFCQVYVYCDSSERIDGEYEEIDIYLNTDWYNFPTDLRRTLPLFIGSLQQPLGFQGFGGTQCTRETFKTIASSGYTYFNALRQFKI